MAYLSREKSRYSIANLSLITGISESNLQHASVEKIGDRRAITKSEVTFVVEAADGGGPKERWGRTP